MIPYNKFEQNSISSIDREQYSTVMLPFLHYKPVLAIELSPRYSLVFKKGLVDRIDGRICAVPSSDGNVTFYRGARLHGDEIAPFISPYRITTVEGIWTVEASNRTLIYR